MMFGLSLVSWIWLCLLGKAMAGDVAPTASSDSCSRDNLLKELLSSLQPSYSLMGFGSSLELLEMKNKLQALETELQSTRAMLESNIKGGSTFVRWGRKTCTTRSQLVYSGVAGGSWYDHSGAAANRLCLSLNPQFDATAIPRYYGFLYGAEYQELGNHNDHDVPCSVCRTAHSTTIMVPATHACPKGWKTQYTGHLAAGYPGHKAASEYVCLDRNLENADSGKRDDNGNLFYYTATRCGSLPCPPYVNNKIVLCAVCSK